MRRSGSSKLSASVMLILSLLLTVQAVVREDRRAVKALKAGEEHKGAWWMKQTALSVDGRLASLKSRRWWKKSLELKPGESLMLEERGEARDRMAIKVESYVLEDGKRVEALVWMIDDDGDESLKVAGDYHDDCYLYDLNRDGLVDIMVDYADENGDGQADFMEIRFFEQGQLVKAWFGYDYENIGEIIKFKNPFDLISGEFSQSLSGNKLHFENAFNPSNRSWWPADICPLASLDFNQDGLSDLTVRFNVKATDSEPDIHSLELSFDADRGNSQENPFHYDLGLILEGRQPFDLTNFRIFSALRRPPQEVFTVPYQQILETIRNYQATRAGFSWKEFYDQTGMNQTEIEELQGQGIGWSWERETIFSSSPDVQKWNVRREVVSKLSGPPEFYLSGLDLKIHISGAEKGWLPIGYLGSQPRIGEIRYFDTDGNGFFDRREVYLANSARPVLVMTASDEKVRKIDFDFNQISEFYLNEVLPEIAARTDRMLRAMREIYVYDPPAGFSQAMSRAAFSERCYLQDVYCLLYFINLRDHFLTLANQTLFQEMGKDSSGKLRGDLYPGLFRDPRQVASSLPSDRAWKLASLITELEMAFSQADIDGFLEAIKKIKNINL